MLKEGLVKARSYAREKITGMIITVEIIVTVPAIIFLTRVLETDVTVYAHSKTTLVPLETGSLRKAVYDPNTRRAHMDYGATMKVILEDGREGLLEDTREHEDPSGKKRYAGSLLRMGTKVVLSEDGLRYIVEGDGKSSVRVQHDSASLPQYGIKIEHSRPPKSENPDRSSRAQTTS